MTIPEGRRFASQAQRLDLDGPRSACKFTCMSTKTIAVESSVYDRLAREKRASESFTKTIERLIHSASSGTCAAAVADAASVWITIGNDADADRMEQIRQLNRSNTNWEVERPA